MIGRGTIVEGESFDVVASRGRSERSFGELFPGSRTGMQPSESSEAPGQTSLLSFTASVLACFRGQPQKPSPLQPPLLDPRLHRPISGG